MSLKTLWLGTAALAILTALSVHLGWSMITLLDAMLLPALLVAAWLRTRRRSEPEGRDSVDTGEGASA